MATTISEIVGLLDEIIERYRPGGKFGTAELALLEREKEKSLARTAQDLTSRGLAGTTIGTGAAKSWEEEIGMPARLRLEDIRSQRLAEAMGAKAGYLEREQERRQTLLENLRQRQFAAQQAVAQRNLMRREASRNYMQQLFPYMYGTTGQRTGGQVGGYGSQFGEMPGSYLGIQGVGRAPLSGMAPLPGGSGEQGLPSTWGGGYGPMFEGPAETVTIQAEAKKPTVTKKPQLASWYTSKLPWLK